MTSAPARYDRLARTIIDQNPSTWKRYQHGADALLDLLMCEAEAHASGHWDWMQLRETFQTLRTTGSADSHRPCQEPH